MTSGPWQNLLTDSDGRKIHGHAAALGDDPNKDTDKEGAFGGQYQGPVIVLTHRPPDGPVPGVTFAGDLKTAVAEAEAAAGDRYVNVLGANVARQCIEAGLLNEVLVFIAPVLLGDGVPLFDNPGGARVGLEPLAGESAHWYRAGY